MCNRTHDEHSLRDALEQLRALIVELQSDAQLEIEVTHDSTAWLEVSFTGKTGEGVKMSTRKGRRAADAVEGVFGGWKRSADSRDGRFLRWAAAEMDGSGDYAFRFIEKFNEGLMTAGTITRQQHHGQMDQLLADTGGRRANSLVQGLIAARNANHILSWLQQRGEEEVTVYRGWRLDQLPTGVVRNARIGGIIRMDNMQVYSRSYNPDIAFHYGEGSIVTRTQILIGQVILTDRSNNPGVRACLQSF